ncbi:MAG: PaaI family thioesterase [Burkholderiales bacterium]|nr:PaaI family thioesterase [Burkholderiales bacterium]
MNTAAASQPANDPSATAAQATAAQWEAELAAVRRRIEAAGGKPGLADPASVAGKTGLEIMQGVLSGELPFAWIADTLDFGLVEVAPGRAVFQGTPQLKHYNPLGTVHGGWYATLLDSALGCAVHTTMPAGCGYTTAELGVNIVRAATEQTGPLRAIGTVIHSGRQLATAEARIVGPDGKLYAHGTTTCLVFAARPR